MTVPFATVVAGCTDPDAENYDDTATLDDGSCTYNGDDALLLFKQLVMMVYVYQHLSFAMGLVLSMEMLAEALIV